MKHLKRFMRTAAALFAVLSVIFFVSHLHHDNQYSFACFVTFITCFYHFAYRLLINAILPKQAEKLSFSCKWFTIKNFEISIFKLLKVKRWREKLPNLLPSVKSAADLSTDMILRETCQAEMMHELDILFSFVPFFVSLFYGSNEWIFLFSGLFTAGFDLCLVIFYRHFRTRLIKPASTK